ncbi:MAG: prepilin-type N-terminal cleavage/methylation domain-containing protein [Desulfobulbus sp.]|nr:prepilin-type N-terminal cleavage/methylation domain-containing protein [Desulfobulbus sp.]
MRHRGFTLLELLLAITVLGVVMAMLGLSLTSTIRVVEATGQEEEVYFQAQTAMRRITEDLAAAISTQQAPFIGRNNSVRSRRADSLDFASQARLILNPDKQKAGVARIRYQLVADQEDERLWKLLRSETLLLPKPESTGEAVADDAEEPAFLLADSLRSVAFRYYDRVGQEFDSWWEAGRSEGASGAGQLPASKTSGIKPTQREGALDTGQPPASKTSGATPTQPEGTSDAGQLPAAVQCILEFWIDPDQGTFQAFSTWVLIPTEPENGR